MHFALFCLITILVNIQAGPLPKLRYRPPKWAKWKPIELKSSSVETYDYDMPMSRKLNTIVEFEEPVKPLQSLNDGRSMLNKKILRLDDNNDERSLENEELEVIDNIRSLLGQNEASDINDNNVRSLFENNKDGLNENDIRSIFGKNDFIHITKRKNKWRNNLLNIVEQLVEDEKQDMQRDQDGRAVMEVALGLQRGLRRYGGLPAKLVYEFNELVNDQE